MISKRIGAYTIDIFLASLLSTAIYMMILPLSMYIPRDTILKFINGRDVLIDYLFIVFLYYLASELIFNRTLGKFIFGLKVVSDNDTKAKAYQIGLRNIFRVTDQLLFLGSLLLFSKKNKRLGDIVAKTKVVDIRSLSHIS